MAEPECPSEMFDFDDEIGVGLSYRTTSSRVALGDMLAP
jgi:hypothetical protein